MFNLSYSEVIEKIKNSTSLSEEEIIENIPKELKINKLIPGMSSVSLIGKIINIYEIKEYSKDNKKGKIGNLILGDETGVIRLVLWDTKHISLLEKNEIALNSVLSIKNGYVKQGLNGLKELHIGN